MMMSYPQDSTVLWEKLHFFNERTGTAFLSPSLHLGAQLSYEVTGTVSVDVMSIFVQGGLDPNKNQLRLARKVP